MNLSKWTPSLRSLVNLLVGLAVIFVSHWLSGTPFGAGSLNYYSDQVIYNDALDAVDKYLDAAGPGGGAVAPGPPIRFLDIDDETYRDWGEPLQVPRDRLAEIVRAADRAGVKVLVFDILLDKPSHDPVADATLRQALAELGATGSALKVVFPANPRPTGGIEPAVLRSISAECPQCYFGAAQAAANGSDRVVRHLRYFRRTVDEAGQERIILSVPMLASLLFYDAGDKIPELTSAIDAQTDQAGPDQVRISFNRPWLGGEPLDIDTSDAITDRIRFRLVPPGVFSPKGRSNLLLGDRFQFKQLPYQADELKGSILIVGNSFEGCCDFHVTPLGEMPGMYVLGNSINTLAGNYQVRRVPPALLWSIEILTLVVFVNWRPLRRSSLAALASMLFFLLTSGIYLLLMRWNIFVDNTFLFFGTSIYLLAIGILDDLIDFYRWLRARIKGGPRGPDALDCPSAG